MEPPKVNESFRVLEMKERKITANEGALVEEKFEDEDLSMVMDAVRKSKNRTDNNQGVRTGYKSLSMTFLLNVTSV